MACEIEVLFAPAEFRVLPQRDLTKTVCVVFDVLRATSTIVTALANGAKAMIPVDEISEALALQKKQPDILLAGERHGLRITGNLTGGVEFDFGNSPREFTRERVAGKTIATTTTNGTRALRSCAGAAKILCSSFLNLKATANRLMKENPAHIIIICAGTFETAAYEDILAAGALVAELRSSGFSLACADSANIPEQTFQQTGRDLRAAMKYSTNARKLLSQPALAGDVDFCLQRDTVDLVAVTDKSGAVNWEH